MLKSTPKPAVNRAQTRERAPGPPPRTLKTDKTRQRAKNGLWASKMAASPPALIRHLPALNRDLKTGLHSRFHPHPFRASKPHGLAASHAARTHPKGATQSRLTQQKLRFPATGLPHPQSPSTPINRSTNHPTHPNPRSSILQAVHSPSHGSFPLPRSALRSPLTSLAPNPSPHPPTPAYAPHPHIEFSPSSSLLPTHPFYILSHPPLPTPLFQTRLADSSPRISGSKIAPPVSVVPPHTAPLKRAARSLPSPTIRSLPHSPYPLHTSPFFSITEPTHPLHTFISSFPASQAPYPSKPMCGSLHTCLFRLCPAQSLPHSAASLPHR